MKIVLRGSNSNLFQLGLKKKLGSRCSNFYCRGQKYIYYIYYFFLAKSRGSFESHGLVVEPPLVAFPNILLQWLMTEGVVVVHLSKTSIHLSSRREKWFYLCLWLCLWMMLWDLEKKKIFLLSLFSFFFLFLLGY